MEQALRGQVFRRQIGTIFDPQDETALDYDLRQQNFLELDIRRKRRFVYAQGAPAANILDKLDYIQPENKNNTNKTNIQVDAVTEPTVTTYFFNKRVGYLASARTLVSLDVDVRSFNTTKFIGVKPIVTHQYDKKTKLRFGFSALPGSTALILGASREFSSYLTFQWQLEQSLRSGVPEASSLQMELEMFGLVKPFAVIQKHQSRVGIRTGKTFFEKHRVSIGADALVRKE